MHSYSEQLKILLHNNWYSKTLLWALYLKPNVPECSSHIGNAGFIVQPTMRGRSIGRLIAEMLKIATLGYSVVMFNLVFEINIASIML